MAKRTTGTLKQVETLNHIEAKRRNIPTAELMPAAQRVEAMQPTPPVRYPRNTDLDPQLVWRGKDSQDWSDLVVQAPPLYIQEKVHPKAIIADLLRQTQARRAADAEIPDLFHDFNGIDPEARAEFYQHDQNWTNRLILGDSLQVMASLAERESLRGQVQCIYFDPPYGIKFNSNWQTSTRSRDVKDGKLEEITREPEQVRAFRDTWKDGIHSYLTYLRDRLTVMRDLLTESGSIFVQIGDENVHRVRAVMDEVFGEGNFASLIFFLKTTGKGSKFVDSSGDYILWYAKDAQQAKIRPIFTIRAQSTVDEQYNMAAMDRCGFRRLSKSEIANPTLIPDACFRFMPSSIYSDSGGRTTDYTYAYRGNTFSALPGYFWRTTVDGLDRLDKADRLCTVGKYVRYKMYADDYPIVKVSNYWDDVRAGGFGEAKVYVVQTATDVVARCLALATDPGDLVLDPTCGSGTTAYVAEQWGRRWITIDTSRVALALARTRLMAARYPWYLLADSREGRQKEAALTGKPPLDTPAHGDIRQGFVYERVPHITLKSIANNAEIDVIWDKWQQVLEPLRQQINAALGTAWEEWQIPRDCPEPAVQHLHADWWQARIQRQQEIDASIARKADIELLYDRPYEDKSRVRVAGPFTVESASPHRIVPVSEPELIDEIHAFEGKRRNPLPKSVAGHDDFTTIILEHLKTAGVQQAKKDDRITFTSLGGWPGDYIAAEGRVIEGETEKRAAIFIGPEFGTLSRVEIIAAAREALEAGFDMLIACGFAFEAQTAELANLGPLPVLKAKMNPELHMSGELKNTGGGNLFVVFGEPDIRMDFTPDGQIVVEVLGVDVFDPKTGQVRASEKGEIAAWLIDTDYNEESFFVRHAYFMGANDPYKALKTTLKAEIDEEAWSTLYRDTSRPFPRPATGRFAVKVINHFGDEVMKVFVV